MSLTPQVLLEFCNASWSSYLLPDVRTQIGTALKLYEREYGADDAFEDYTFIVFPMAKGYEGFLKQYFYDLDLITTKVYESRRFRIGRALNPDVYENQRDEWWLFDDISLLCGERTARMLWETWLTCRNRTFHLFPKKTSTLDLISAGKRLETLSHTMKEAVMCQWDELGAQRFKQST
ncbi:MAG: hypothetical protein GW946_04035 [Candidatus Pacebacteria bacterium]|nr:hypothetical protein [Candidatus Paceibacterota bacterium]PIR59961.1 MAG: hypothetical protein COU67_04230 [Candidatus Pacebacteria bacterium CG10_big_fil_rev_8_21_14_0_10_44_54]